MSCIFGAILYCSGVFHIAGPIAYPPQPPRHVWNYAVYSAPVLQPQPVFFPQGFPITRRG